MKLQIALVGAGNLASALSEALRSAGHGISEIIASDRRGSLQRAKALARNVSAMGVSGARAKIAAEVVWFCVPDGKISEAAAALKDRTDWSGKVAFHSSGALSSDELTVLREEGASVASVHPLMTFVGRSAVQGPNIRRYDAGRSTAGRASSALTGVPFAIEGDRKAIRMALEIVSSLHGVPFAIRKRDKVMYHAWGTFLSPLLIALLAASERVAADAGISRKVARERMLPIVQQTIANYAAAGAPGAFSGPIVRGDMETVEKHLKVLRRVEGAREVYVALARVALRDLPSKNRSGLKKILSD
jgi:predicted short-subunit dehydrogenase-like oxidoreductase (DUF2520 family)